MKWYEKQKQAFAQKSDSPSNDDSLSSVYEDTIHEDEPVINTNNTQGFKETPFEQYPYDEKTLNEEQFDKILDDPTSAYVPAERYSQTMENKETTTIGKGTQIIGDIESDDNLVIRGNVKGNIICNANLSVYGEVEGTIQCASAYFDEALITGDVTSSNDIKMTSTSSINGNVEANELINGGRIKGNATIGEGIHFASTSAIVGNISAKDIDIERGAVIQGNINIRQEVYFEK